MLLILKDLIYKNEETLQLKLSERVPNYILGPCTLQISYKVEAENDFYLIHLQVKGSLDISCQRCLSSFNYPYKNQSVIAIASSETRAEALQETYECIVSNNGQVVLDDLIIDELYLYVIQSHPNEKDCDSEITSKFLSGS